MRRGSKDRGHCAFTVQPETGASFDIHLLNDADGHVNLGVPIGTDAFVQAFFADKRKERQRRHNDLVDMGLVRRRIRTGNNKGGNRRSCLCQQLSHHLGTAVEAAYRGP